MKTDFLASGNHVLPFSQTAVNCCQWKQFFLQLEHSENEFFLSTGNSIFLFQAFFPLMENITEIWGKSNFKDDPYSCLTLVIVCIFYIFL